VFVVTKTNFKLQHGNNKLPVEQREAYLNARIEVGKKTLTDVKTIPVAGGIWFAHFDFSGYWKFKCTCPNKAPFTVCTQESSAHTTQHQAYGPDTVKAINSYREELRRKHGKDAEITIIPTFVKGGVTETQWKLQDQIHLHMEEDPGQKREGCDKSVDIMDIKTLFE
jgi:hypothetical protein